MGRVTTKTKGIRGWIPAIVLSVMIVGVGVTAGVLVSSGVGSPAPQPTLGQVTELNWSSFSEDGLAYIARTREVRIDLSRPPVDASALGLPDDGLTVLDPIDNGDVMLSYGLIVNGGGESPGGDKFTVSSIEIETRGGILTRVSAPLDQVLNFRQTLALLEADAELYGWQPIDTAALFERVEVATRDAVGYDFTFGPGDRLGVAIAATASCDASGYCVVEYDVTPSVR